MSVYKGVAINPVTPTYSGSPPDSFSANPPLPAGLSLDPVTGVISGTLTAGGELNPVLGTTITVTATNGAGSFTTILSISIMCETASTQYMNAACSANPGELIVNGEFESLTGCGGTCPTGWVVPTDTSATCSDSSNTCLQTETAGKCRGSDGNVATQLAYNDGYAYCSPASRSVQFGCAAAVNPHPIYADIISQTVTGLTIGARYRLSFFLRVPSSSTQVLVTFDAALDGYLGPRGLPPFVLNDMNGQGLAGTSASCFMQYSYTFEATATTGQLMFTGLREDGTTAADSPVLDRVSLVPV